MICDIIARVLVNNSERTTQQTSFAFYLHNLIALQMKEVMSLGAYATASLFHCLEHVLRICQPLEVTVSEPVQVDVMVVVGAGTLIIIDLTRSSNNGCETVASIWTIAV